MQQPVVPKTDSGDGHLGLPHYYNGDEIEQLVDGDAKFSVHARMRKLRRPLNEIAIG